MRRYTIGLIGLFGLTAGSFAQQAPAPLPAFSDTFIQVPAAQDKKDDKKKDDKKDDAKQPEPPVPPPVTFPATNRAALPASAVAAAGTSISRSSQPNVYGNNLTGSRFSPILIATLPTGQRVGIQPGQTALLPVGTTFDRPVATELVTSSVVVLDPRAPTNGLHQVVRVTQVRVTGPDAIAHAGGLPINVVRGTFKIAENESPRPTDRIYATYNFFSDVNPTLSAPGLPITNVHRETFGLEKTFLDGNASVGIRLPLLQIGGPSNIERQSVGDITTIFKYAITNETIERGDGSTLAGNCLSVGLAVTVPTGDAASYSTPFPKIHPTVLQPFVGMFYVQDLWHLQGFSSVAVPLDRRDTTYLFNSLQVGYRLFESPQEDRWIRSVTPIVECHVNTPLNNRGIYRLPIGAFDEVSITTGATFGLGRAAYLNLGANVPLTGPKPYAIEALAQLNMRY